MTLRIGVCAAGCARTVRGNPESETRVGLDGDGRITYVAAETLLRPAGRG